MIKKDEFAKGLAGTQAQMARWTRMDWPLKPRH
jgi:hypothetical protein